MGAAPSHNFLKFGPYHVIRELGGGAFGTVYEVLKNGNPNVNQFKMF